MTPKQDSIAIHTMQRTIADMQIERDKMRRREGQLWDTLAKVHGEVTRVLGGDGINEHARISLMIAYDAGRAALAPAGGERDAA